MKRSVFANVLPLVSPTRTPYPSWCFLIFVLRKLITMFLSYPPSISVSSTLPHKLFSKFFSCNNAYVSVVLIIFFLVFFSFVLTVFIEQSNSFLKFMPVYQSQYNSHHYYQWGGWDIGLVLTIELSLHWKYINNLAFHICLLDRIFLLNILQYFL